MKTGLPFLHEGGDALAIIVGEAELAHRVALAVELGVEAVAPAFAQHRLDAGKSACRAGGEAGGEGVHLRVEPVVVHGLPDQTPVRGAFRLQRLAGQGEAERAGLADQAGQRPGAAAVGDQADGGEALDEFRAFRRDDDVAGERDVRARAGRDAVHPGDDRHGQAHQSPDQRIVAKLHRLAEIDRLARRDGAVAQILPRAEAPARAGQHQAARVAELRRARPRPPRASAR